MIALARRLADRLLASSFIRFAMVGTGAMLVDMSVVQALVMGEICGPGPARVPAFLVAATFAWAMNRAFTFRAADRSGPLAQWLRYVSANAIGLGVNLAVYWALIYSFPLVYDWPFIGVAAGSVAGLAFNFTASRRFVFAAKRLP